MPTYDEVKNKIKTLRKRIIKDMTYGMFERRRKAVNATLTAIKTILTKLTDNINVASPYAIDTRLIELYNTTLASEIGEKKVAVDYNDETMVLDGREVVPFDTFSFDYNAYVEALKKSGVELAKRAVLFRTPISETAPTPDFESTGYYYYIPRNFEQSKQWEIDLEGLFGIPGVLARFAEHRLYNFTATEYDISKIAGQFDYFNMGDYIPGLECAISTGGILKVYDSANPDDKWDYAYKYVVVISNDTDYNMDVCVWNKPHNCPAHQFRVYVYLTDIHLKGTPFLVFCYNFSTGESCL